MADKKGNWKSLVQQLATLNLSTRRECDPFWLMISRRLTKRKMESSDTEKGGEEGEPAPSTSGRELSASSRGPCSSSRDPSTSGREPSASSRDPSTSGRRSPTLPEIHASSCAVHQPGHPPSHRFKVLIGEQGDRLEQMKTLHFDCPLADKWKSFSDDVPPSSDLASGDDSDRLIKSVSTASGYEFIRRVRQGKFSKIFLGRPKDSNSRNKEENVIIKLTSHRHAPDESDGQTGSGNGCFFKMSGATSAKRSRLASCGRALSDEAEIHSRLSHTNIVQIHKHITEGDTVGIIMEWCQLGNMEEIIRKSCSGLIAEAIARRYFAQMVEALEYVHRAGFVHRSVALRHFLVDHRDVVKLSDFSAADSVLNAQVHISQDVGSVGYKPPEYLQNKPCDARQFDLWALGCCLFKMTTARLPFGWDGRKLQQQGGRLEFPNVAVVLSAELRELLKGQLAVLPEARFSMTRVRNSAWLRTRDARAFIGNAHLLQPLHKHSVSPAEQGWKSSFDI